MPSRRWLAVAAAPLLIACASRVVDQKPRPVVTQPQTVSGDLPCEVEQILADVCRYCHTSPPRNGAPFSLATYADTQALVDGRPIYEFMRDAVASGRMPLSPMTLDEDQRATLIAWAEAGGRARDEGASCRAPGGDDDAAAPDDAATDAATDTATDAGATEDADADAAP